MKSPSEALAFLEAQRKSGSDNWFLKCESLQRQAYGLRAHYRSAEIHAKAIPKEFKHGHEKPSKGDIALFLNGGFGHIVTCTGVGWGCYTNDYKGRGKVAKISDLRDLVGWCNASSWFIADAWWSSTNHIRTHDVPVAPKPPVVVPPGKESIIKDDDMAFIFRSHANTDTSATPGGGAIYLVIGDKAVQVEGGYTQVGLPVFNSTSERGDDAFYKAVTRYLL